MRTDTHANETRMPCAAVPMEDLKAHLDGELSGMRRYFVGKHLARCASCREEVASLRQFGAEMRDLETAVPSPQLRQRIMANLPEIAPVPSAPVRWKPNPMPRYALAGAFSLLLVIGAFALNRTMNTNPAETTAIAALSTPVVLPNPQISEPKPIVVNTNTPKVILPSDELSEKADQIVAAQEKSREQQERKAWRRWVRQIPELRQTVAHRTMPERVSLTVNPDDTETAVETLRQKVAALGGKLYAVSSGTTQTGVFSNVPSEQLYAVKIPTTQLSRLALALHETGDMHAAVSSKLPAMYRKTGMTAADITKPIEGTPSRFDEKALPAATAKPNPATPPKAKTVFVLVALRNQ